MVIKRILDIIIALTALIVLSPVIVVTAAAIRLTMGRPVLFRQRRAGLHGRPFTILKFRTMTQACSETGELLSDANRLTKLGQFLRRTSIDELPQLWNVLEGDMSLIGPRPLPIDYLGLYSNEQMLRHNVPPGIVGWAGVKGRNSTTWEERFQLDIWYVRNWSLLLDAKIFLLAIVTVLRASGVSYEGEVTMPRFTGTGQDTPTPESLEFNTRRNHSA